jgi:hypothetical protein
MPRAQIVGPLLPDYNEDALRARGKAAATFLALVTVGRVFPATAGPLVRLGLGVEVAAGGGLGTLTPFGLTNLLPQPFGFVPAKDFGLQPNFFLPGTAGSGLPNFFPGAVEQREIVQADIANRQAQRARDELNRFLQIAQQRGSQLLEEQLAALQANPGGSGFENPQQIIDALAAILAQREAERIANNAALAALAALKGAAAVPFDQQLNQGGSQFPPTPTTAPPGAGPTGPVVVPQGPNLLVPQGQRPQSGFVEVPGSGNNVGGGTTTGPTGGYNREFGRGRSGPFIDRFIAGAHGDP